MRPCFPGLVIHRGGKVGADPGAAGAPDLKLLIDVSQLEAIEVYRSASEIPIEFSGPTAACGVIVLWTRRAP